MAIARQLVAAARAEVDSELPRLEARIKACLDYLDGVETPNLNTKLHVRWYLTGLYDSTLGLE